MNSPVKVRAKFRVTQVAPYKNEDGQTTLEHWEMYAVGGNDVEHGYPEDGSDEDNTFSKWTPNAHLTMDVQNPALFDVLKAGDKYYVDFTLAEEVDV